MSTTDHNPDQGAALNAPERLTDALNAVPGVREAIARVEQLHGEYRRLTEAMLAAEGDVVDLMASARESGLVDWRHILALYELHGRWSGITGLTGHRTRWLQRIPYEWQGLLQLAASVPERDDGTWRGNTGFDGLLGGDAPYPARGAAVAFVLFGNGQVPVHIGFTENFRARLKTLHKNGLNWESWLAVPCRDRKDSVEVRRELARRYGEPNVAAAPSRPEDDRR
jgi:hypothetical protein